MRRWAEAAVLADARANTRPTPARIGAMAAIGWLALCQGCHDDAARILAELRRAGGDAAGPETALPAPVELAEGTRLLLAERDPAAVSVFGRARAGFAAAGDTGGAATAEMFEALAAGFFGPEPVASGITRRHLAAARASGADWALSWAELAVAIALVRFGDPHAALSTARTALRRQLHHRDQWGALWAVHICAWALAAQVRQLLTAGAETGDIVAPATETALLVGGARTLRAGVGVDLDGLGPFAEETRTAIATARRVLGDSVFEATEREGAQLRPEHHEAQQLALGGPASAAPAAPVAVIRPEWHELTAAERDVAVLAASGLPNSALAARRGSSTKTVAAQMSAIFHKLMIGSRREIAAFVPDALLDREPDTGRGDGPAALTAPAHR